MSRRVSHHFGSYLLFLLLGVMFAAVPVLAGDAQSTNTFVKLDIDGKELPASAAQWAMVKDTKTGLIWEAKTTDGSIHDAGNQYSWKETKVVFLAELNKIKFGGYDDWRMPSDTEIGTLLRRDREEPFVDATYFPHVRPANYWNFYICGSGATMSGRQCFGNKKARAAKEHVMAVRGEKM